MRFTNDKNPTANSLDVNVENMTLDSHVHDIINPIKWSNADYNYFKETITKINKKMSAPESALVMRTIYDQRYFLAAAQKSKSLQEMYLGSVLFRKNEELSDFSMFNKLLKDYKRNEIKQCLGLTIREYLNLTPYEKYMMDKFAISWTKEMAKIMQDQQHQSDERLNSYRKSMENVKDAVPNKVPHGATMNTLNEQIEEMM